MLSADSRSRMWDVDASEDCICCESQYLIEPATGLLGKTDKLLRAPSNDGSVPNIGLRSKALSNPIHALAVFESQEAQWPTMGEELIPVLHTSENLFRNWMWCFGIYRNRSDMGGYS